MTRARNNGSVLGGWILGAMLVVGCSAGTIAPVGGSTPNGPFTPDDLSTPSPRDMGGPHQPAPDLSTPGPMTQLQTCFPTMGQANVPNYAQFNPVVGTHCNGTNHQNIQGVEQIIFVGDSVTAGTPPTLPTDYYRVRMTAALLQKYGLFTEVHDCSVWGARTDDLILGPNMQVQNCVGQGSDKTTLVVMTIGGNDMHAAAKKGAEGESLAESLARADQSIQELRDTIDWLKAPGRFPNGVYVLFANVYEYTDGVGDPLVCSAAALADLGPWPYGRDVYLHYNEGFVRTAVETQTDIIFLLEKFCGHGYNNENPASECYKGPGQERWFDLTCIHPNPAGHGVIADMFMSVINE